MNSVEKDMADYLEDQGYGTVGTDIFYNEQPADVDNCITVFEQPGRGYSQFRCFSSFTPNIHGRNFQVLVRNSNYTNGYDNIIGIQENFLSKAKFTMSDVDSSGDDDAVYLAVVEQSDIIPLGLDGNNRYQWSVNFRTVRRKK